MIGLAANTLKFRNNNNNHHHLSRMCCPDASRTSLHTKRRAVPFDTLGISPWKKENVYTSSGTKREVEKDLMRFRALPGRSRTPGTFGRGQDIEAVAPGVKQAGDVDEVADLPQGATADDPGHEVLRKLAENGPHPVAQ